MMRKREKKVTEEQSLKSIGKHSDFTSDANKFSKDKKRTKATILGQYNHTIKILQSAKRDSPEWLKAKKMYEELGEYVIGDFTEDVQDATYRKLISLFNQLDRLLGKSQMYRMLEKLSDAERSVLYNHPLNNEFSLLP